MKKEILLTFQNRNTKVPYWFMRQAGRYLPEYQSIKNSSKNFLEMCFNVEKSYEITLQPLKRFDVDAAIIFADILLLPHILGWNLEFLPNVGPVMKEFIPQRNMQDLRQDFSGEWDQVLKLIKKLSYNLSSYKTLIGFAGAPWTVASYMIEGKGKTSLSKIKKMAYDQDKKFLEFIDFLTEKTICYLESQIIAGVEMIQIFESSASHIPYNIFKNFVIDPTKIIVSTIKQKFPHVPIVCFPKYVRDFYLDYAYAINPDGISVDFLVPLEIIKKLQKSFVVQGTLDPAVLLCEERQIEEQFWKIFNYIDKRKFIFNLGDGILPNTPIKKLDFLIGLIKKNNSKSFYN